MCGLDWSLYIIIYVFILFLFTGGFDFQSLEGNIQQVPTLGLAHVYTILFQMFEVYLIIVY